MLESVPLKQIIGRSNEEAFCAVSCVLSDASRPRPEIAEFLRREDVFVTQETIIDIVRGITRIKETYPDKCHRLGDWLDRELSKRSVLSSRIVETAHVIAAIMECRQLKNVWLPHQRKRNPTFGHHVATAATAIANGIPIAAVSVTKFLEIDRYFPLPGVYEVLSRTWVREQRSAEPVRYPPTA